MNGQCFTHESEILHTVILLISVDVVDYHTVGYGAVMPHPHHTVYHEADVVQTSYTVSRFLIENSHFISCGAA
jgi:hypothetical protein